MTVQIHGFTPREGEVVFAFVAVRLAAPIDRARMIELARGLEPIVPEVDELIAQIPEEIEADLRYASFPWLPPEGDDMVAAQRAVLERVAELGIEEIWFAQTGTQLPVVHEADDEDEDGEAEGEDDGGEAEAEDERRDSWTHGPPPQVSQVRFPVDNYPEILEAYDWEDFGIACKLAGPWVAGEATVIYSLHALWLNPYSGCHRNAAVTIDPQHHAVHFWVDRFSAPCDQRELVLHLLWIVSKLDEIFPVVHARFAGATMAQKYGSLVGDDSAPFVMGGNPLRPVYAIGGEAAVDTWIESQTTWANDEISCMLRELAIEVLSEPPPDSPSPDADAEDDEAEGDEAEGDDADVELDVDAMFDAAIEEDEEDDAADEGAEAEAGEGKEDEGDEDEGDEADGDEADGDEDDSDEADGDEADGDEDDSDEDDSDEADSDEADGDEDDGDEEDEGEEDEDDDDDDDEEEDDDDDEEEDDDPPRPARRASLTMVAGEVLVARAQAGLLDTRVTDALSTIPTTDAADPRLPVARRVIAAWRGALESDDHDVN